MLPPTPRFRQDRGHPIKVVGFSGLSIDVKRELMWLDRFLQTQGWGCQRQTQGHSLEEDKVASLLGSLWLWGLDMKWAGDWHVGTAGRGGCWFMGKDL